MLLTLLACHENFGLVRNWPGRWLYHLCFGMTGEATTGSRLNRTESPSPSLLNTVYSEAGWFGVIFPVFSQTNGTICIRTVCSELYVLKHYEVLCSVNVLFSSLSMVDLWADRTKNWMKAARRPAWEGRAKYQPKANRCKMKKEEESPQWWTVSSEEWDKLSAFTLWQNKIQQEFLDLDGLGIGGITTLLLCVVLYYIYVILFFFILFYGLVM